MPLVERKKHGAEGQWVEPAPRREPQPKVSVKLRICLGWWYLTWSQGISLREMAANFKVTIHEMSAGLARAQAYLTAADAFNRTNVELPLSPLLGCQAWPPRPRKDGKCPVCKGTLRDGHDRRADRFICCNCDTVSPSNQKLFDLQIRAEKVKEDRAKANWRATQREAAAT